MKYTKTAKDQAYKHLVNTYGLSSTNKTAATVTSVASSGMSRWIKLYILKDNEILNISYHSAVLLGETYDDHKGFKVSGVGMDMIFHSLYRLNVEMIKQHIKEPERVSKIAYQKRGAYNYFVDTNYSRV